MTDRSAREVLDDHLSLRAAGDLEGDLRRNYHEEIVILTPTQSFRGHDGVRQSAALLYRALEGTDDYDYHSVQVDDRMGLLEWSARSPGMEIVGGVDSYLIEDGLICAQTIRYTVIVKELSYAMRVA